MWISAEAIKPAATGNKYRQALFILMSFLLLDPRTKSFPDLRFIQSWKDGRYDLR
jgi:hypothetical protein